MMVSFPVELNPAFFPGAPDVWPHHPFAYTPADLPGAAGLQHHHALLPALHAAHHAAAAQVPVRSYLWLPLTNTTNSTEINNNNNIIINNNLLTTDTSTKTSPISAKCKFIISDSSITHCFTPRAPSHLSQPGSDLLDGDIAAQCLNRASLQEEDQSLNPSKELTIVASSTVCGLKAASLPVSSRQTYHPSI